MNVTFVRKKSYTDVSYKEEHGDRMWPVVVKCGETHEVIREVGIIHIIGHSDNDLIVMWEDKDGFKSLAIGVDLSEACDIASVSFRRLKRRGNVK